MSTVTDNDIQYRNLINMLKQADGGKKPFNDTLVYLFMLFNKNPLYGAIPAVPHCPGCHCKDKSDPCKLEPDSLSREPKAGQVWLVRFKDDRIELVTQIIEHDKPSLWQRIFGGFFC